METGAAAVTVFLTSLLFSGITADYAESLKDNLWGIAGIYGGCAW